jgi:heptosyltransferase-2
LSAGDVRPATKHFLIVRLSGIGDVVMASTVLRRLRGEHPDARITWLSGITAAPLVERYAGLSAVIAIDERRLLRGGAADRVAVLVPLWRRLAREAITDVVLLHADWRYRALTSPLLGARVRRLSRARGSRALVPGRYMGDDYAMLLDPADTPGPAVGHFPLADIRLEADASSEHFDVILVPGGAKNVLRESALRRWPVASYRIVAETLISEGYKVALIGDASDEWVRPSFAGLTVADRIGAMTLGQTLDAMRLSRIVISHDTGPMHLARLAGAPLVALFGPTMPSQFIVEDERTVALWGGAHLACRPCYDGRELAPCLDNLCMSTIPTSLVLDTARRQLCHAGPRSE